MAKRLAQSMRETAKQKKARQSAAQERRRMIAKKSATRKYRGGKV